MFGASEILMKVLRVGTESDLLGVHIAVDRGEVFFVRCDIMANEDDIALEFVSL